MVVNLKGDRCKLQQLLELVASTKLKDSGAILEQINKGRIKIIINGKPVTGVRLNEIQLEDGDQIVFLPPFGGG